MDQMTKYWCNRCELAFDGISSSDIYEQSKCEDCGTECLTLASELEDARKSVAQNEVMGAIASGIFGMLGGILGFAASRRMLSNQQPKVLEYAEKFDLKPPFLTVESEADALLIQREFGEHGIICGVIYREQEGDYEIDVEPRDWKRANRVIEDSV